jgi:hypothetical protein
LLRRLCLLFELPFDNLCTPSGGHRLFTLRRDAVVGDVRAEESDEDAALSAKQVRTALVLHEDSFLSEGFVALAPETTIFDPSGIDASSAFASSKDSVVVAAGDATAQKGLQCQNDARIGVALPAHLYTIPRGIT